MICNTFGINMQIWKQKFTHHLYAFLILLSLLLLIITYLHRSSTTTLFLFVSTLIDRPVDSPELTLSKALELNRSRIAVCLVGGARSFELTGPSIIDRVLNQFPNSDLFLNSPLDSNSYKISLLKAAPRVASVRIYKPAPIPQSDSQLRILAARGSPNGIQGLLQYFNPVEGCLTLIDAYPKEQGFRYDWIVRTRVDGYWSAPLDPSSFIKNQYVIPRGSTFGGLDDRFCVGDYNTSKVALSRLSLLPALGKLNFTNLSFEKAFKAQLSAYDISYQTSPQPFCIVTDRTYSFPPRQSGVPVAALSNLGPLNGAKCRACKPSCVGDCATNAMLGLVKGWSWERLRNETLELCDASGEWEIGWEKVFDDSAGKRLAKFRKRVGSLNVKECMMDFEEMKGKTAKWDTPPLEEMCKLGLDHK